MYNFYLKAQTIQTQTVVANAIATQPESFVNAAAIAEVIQTTQVRIKYGLFIV
jgi:hypothetical protein